MNIKKLLGGLSLNDIDVNELANDFVNDVIKWANDKDDTRGYMTVLEAHRFYRYIVDPMDVPMAIRDKRSNPPDKNIDLQVHPLALLNKIDSYIYDSRAMRNLFDRRDHGDAMALITAYTLDAKYYPGAPISNYASYKAMISSLSDWLESDVFGIIYDRNIKKDGNADKFKLFVALRSLVYLYYNKLFESMKIFNLRNYWINYNEEDRGVRTLVSNAVLATPRTRFETPKNSQLSEPQQSDVAHLTDTAHLTTNRATKGTPDNRDTNEDVQNVNDDDNNNNNKQEEFDKEEIFRLLKASLTDNTPKRLIRRLTNDESPPPSDIIDTPSRIDNSYRSVTSGIATPDLDTRSPSEDATDIHPKLRTVISFKDKTSIEFIRETTRSTITVDIRGGQIIGREYVRSVSDAEALQSLFEAIREYDRESSVAIANYYIQEQSKPKYDVQVIRSVHRARRHKNQLVNDILNVYVNVIRPNNLIYSEAALRAVENYVFSTILKTGATPEELKENLMTGRLWCM
jgi:hypothetical protein